MLEIENELETHHLCIRIFLNISFHVVQVYKYIRLGSYEI